MAMDCGERRIAEGGVSGPSGGVESMPYVIARVFLAQRAQMVGGDDPLPQLLERRIRQHLTELGLTEQHALERRPPGNRDIRQHAQFFQGGKRQVLGLVDDQQATLAQAVPFGKSRSSSHSSADLSMVSRRMPKPRATIRSRSSPCLASGTRAAAKPRATILSRSSPEICVVRMRVAK